MVIGSDAGGEVVTDIVEIDVRYNPVVKIGAGGVCENFKAVAITMASPKVNSSSVPMDGSSFSELHDVVQVWERVVLKCVYITRHITQ